MHEYEIVESISTYHCLQSARTLNPIDELILVLILVLVLVLILILVLEDPLPQRTTFRIHLIFH